MDRVVGDLNGELSARDIDAAQRVVVTVLGMQTVLAGGEGERAVRDGEAVLGADRVLGRSDLIDAIGDGHLVLAGDAVTGGGADPERTRAVEGDIVLDVDHRVHLVFVDLDKRAAV